MTGTKIALLQNKHYLDRVFTSAHIDQLRRIGEVSVTERDGPITIEETKRLIAGADVAITSWDSFQLTEELLECAPNLRVVLHAAGTVKPIVTPALWARGIRVANAAEALGKGVAETALGLTIASLKDMWRLSSHTRAGGWADIARVRELYGITVGVVGAGKAGGHYIRLLQSFDVDVLVCDPGLTAEQAADLGAEKAELERLLAESDVISIHAPPIPATERMFNRETLALCKDSCIIINTAKGSIIDEDALLAELRRGRLFACLDVTNPEPPAVDHPLRGLSNVVLTPHIAGSVNNGLHRVAAQVIGDVKRFLAGERMVGEVEEAQLGMLA